MGSTATFTFILNPCVQLFASFPADKNLPFVREIERKVALTRKKEEERERERRESERKIKKEREIGMKRKRDLKLKSNNTDRELEPVP